MWAPASASGQEYVAVAVPTLGGPSNAAYAINASGLVVGTSSLDAQPGGDSRAFIWDPASGALTQIGTFGGSDSVAYGVNNAGAVTGLAWLNTGVHHAFLWQNGTLIDLTPGDVSWFTAGWDINGGGVVIGHRGTRGFVWSGTLLDPGSMGTPTRAYGINNAGQVVGESGLRAFFWQDDGDPTTVDIRDLGTLPGGLPRARARDINDAGQVVGEANFGSSDLEDYHAVLWENLAWDPTGQYIGQITDLGALPGGQRSFALAINDAGVVVGYATASGIAVPHAFVWDAIHGLRDLNNLIPAGSGWTLEFAYDVNNRGQIVGAGRLNGVQRAFFLNPLSVAADLNGDGQIDLDDVTLFLRDFGCANGDCIGDIDGDGDTDLDDLALLLASLS